MSSNPNNQRPQINSIPYFNSNYSTKKRYQISFPKDSSFTKQEFKEECDINTIMAQYMATGQMPNINEEYPQYLDVTGIEFQASMEFVAGAQTKFEELPSSIRNRFDNDPAAFLDFCSQEKNRPELAEMGLLKPKTEAPIPSPQPLPANAEASDPVPPAQGSQSAS